MTPKLASGAALFGVYFGYTRKHTPLFIAVILSNLLLQVANLIAPLYMRDFFNILATPGHTVAATSSLMAVLGLVVLWWFVEWFADLIENVSITYLTSKVMANLFSYAFEYLIGHSYDFFVSSFSGALTQRVNKFGQAYDTILDSITSAFLPATFFIIGAVIVLYLHNHFLGIALGIWSICFVLLQLYIARIRQPLREAGYEADTYMTGTLADAISNHSTILLFSGNKHEGNVFDKSVRVWRAATTRSWLADTWTWAAIGIFVIGIEAGLLYWAILFWSKGLLTLGDFVLIQTYLLTTFNHLTGINNDLRRFYNAYTDASGMMSILETQYQVSDIQNAKEVVVNSAAIKFDHVDFFFHEDQLILKNFNLTIKGGEKIALVGPSGAGKSTITKLLLRFFDVKRGSILIDEQNISSVTQASLRDAIAFVPQEPILFHRSLMENIRYGRRDATDEEVIAAATKARCHDFIYALPERYNTLVGERGIKLSGGERQRVAIARAILKNAPILLLDEATSSLDSQSESLIQEALETLMVNKTVIVIAHRLSTIMKMDRIIVLQNGTVVAEGTHRQLLEQDGLYQKLWSIQAGGFLLDQDQESSEDEPLNDVEENLADDDEEQ